MKSTSLSLTAQTAFAQVVEVALSADVMRSVSDLPGTFVPKTIKSRKYWYYQFSEPSGARRQLFVGPDNDAVRALVAKSREASSSESLGPLVRSAVALGNAQVLPRHFKVLRRLAEYGFFPRRRLAHWHPCIFVVRQHAGLEMGGGRCRKEHLPGP